jgi:nucleoside-diphosphate-sugar epimerase
MLAGGLLSALCRPLGLDPPLAPARVRTLTQSRLYDISRAAERLGFRPEVGLDEGLKRTVNWYLENGHLERRPS